MSSSFGDNKRKPGAGASAVTEARRLAAVAQTWTSPSKQPKVTSGTQVAGVMSRNSGVLSLKNAEQNGYAIPPVIIPINYIDLDFSNPTGTEEGNPISGYINVPVTRITATTYFRITSVGEYIDRLTFRPFNAQPSSTSIQVNGVVRTPLWIGQSGSLQVPFAIVPEFRAGDIITLTVNPTTIIGDNLIVTLYRSLIV